MASYDHATVRRLLASSATFTGRELDVESIYHDHDEEKCFRIGIPGSSRPYKVRFTTSASRHSVLREHEALRLLIDRGVSWAAPVVEYQRDDPSFLVTLYEPGHSLDRSTEWTSHALTIRERLRELLDDVHAIRGDYYGHLGGPRHPSWDAFLEGRLRRHVDAAVVAGFLSEGDRMRVDEIYRAVRPALGREPSVLLHSDVKPANILFDAATGAVTLVDFELARFGDPDFEWVKLDLLSRRWLEYRRLVAGPLFRDDQGARSADPYERAKRLLYSLYHVCSVVEDENRRGRAVPPYRRDDLMGLLAAARSWHG